MHCVIALSAMCLLAAPVPGVQGVRWVLVDVDKGVAYRLNDSSSKLSAGGKLVASPNGSGLSLEATYQPSHEACRVGVRLTDTSGKERGVTVRLELVLAGSASDWLWWQDSDTSLPLASRPRGNLSALRGLPGLPYFTEEAERPDFGRYSVYPVGAVSRGASWLAVGRRIRDSLVARFTALASDHAILRAEVDAALSNATRPQRRAEFSLWVMGGNGEGAGLRAALALCHSLWAEDWRTRAKRLGGWMPFTPLSSIPNVDEFGFAYQEGARNPAFDDKLGALSFVYFHCAGEFANVPGYQRGSRPLPPYEKVVAAFNAIAGKRTGIDGVWDLCGIRGPDGKIAYRPEKVYGDFFCQACVDPDLPYGKAMAEQLVQRITAAPFPKGIDGVYYDGIAAGLDYAPEHLRAANHLLLWDARRRRPVNYNLFSSVEWAAYIHDRLRDTGKLTMLNDGSLSSFVFVIPYIDVPGGEMGINLQRRQARLIRALAYHKPFCTLVKADFSRYYSFHIETYMRRCTAYGILFGFFDIAPSGAHPGSSYWVHPEWYDRDRPLFRRYMPLVRELARAGWEPLTFASVARGKAYVERFGPGPTGLAYLTVSTDPGLKAQEEVQVQLGPDFPMLARKALAVELLTGRIQPTSGKLSMKLRGDDLAVWAIGPAEAQAAACLWRARDILDRRKGYLEACRSQSVSLTPWRPYAEQGGKVVTGGRKGGHCLMASLDKPGGRAGATQTIVLKQDKPQPLIVSAWSKAEGVTGAQDRDYSLYVDCYYTDGTALYGQAVTFAVGSHDWQYGERLIKPEKPIRNVNVYLLFRGNHTGTVWFDDVRVAPAGEPEKNLLKRPGFEGPAGRPLAADSSAAKTVNDAFARLRAVLNASPEQIDYDAAEKLLARAEQAARGADWGADTERTLRDVEDLRWHLRLAQLCLVGRATPALRPSRITEHVSLTASRRASGVKAYTASTGSVPRGTKIAVDSLYPGYTATPLTDGAINPKGAHWTKVAWASADDDTAHWIELRFPKPGTVVSVKVWWALDAGKLWVSHAVELQALQGSKWVAIEGQKQQTDPKRGLTVIRGPPTEAQALRIYQPPAGGPAERPGVMWVSEIEVQLKPE